MRALATTWLRSDRSVATVRNVKRPAERNWSHLVIRIALLLMLLGQSFLSPPSMPDGGRNELPPDRADREVDHVDRDLAHLAADPPVDRGTGHSDSGESWFEFQRLDLRCRQRFPELRQPVAQ
jgi:hypothetical protein